VGATDRLRRLLEYLVTETLDGRGNRIKAYSIATEVFGRPSSFDPKDPIVRIEAARLRRQIVENAGVEGSTVVGKLLEKDGNYGCDAQNEEYGDLVAKGIIAPAKVVRVALQDAASVASLLITT